MSDLSELPGWGSLRADAAPEPTARVAQGPQARPARLDSIRNAISGFGDPTYDKSVNSRPNTFRIPLNDVELWTLYQQALPRRVVNLLPSRATRKGWSVPEIGVTVDRELGTWGEVCYGGQMAGLGGGALGVMVTEDDVPGAFRRDPQRWLEQPLDLDRVGRLENLIILDARQATPAAWETNPRVRGYGMPRIWSLSAEGLPRRIHASRVLHFRGARRPPSVIRGGWWSGPMPDDSVLQALWDELSRLETVMQSGAIFAQELRESVLKIADLPAKQTGEEAEQFQLRMAAMQQAKSQLRTNIISKDDEYYSNSNAPTGIKDLSDGAFQMLCTALGWPASMLSGEPPGGMSTDDESGLERERALVSDYQETELRHLLEQLYRTIYRSQDGPTGGVEPEEWEVSFAALNEPSAKEVAEVRKLVMEADVMGVTAGILPPEAITEGRFGEEGWQLDLPPVELPDPIEEAEIEAERMRILREAGALPGAPGEDPDADPDVEDEPAEEEE